MASSLSSKSVIFSGTNSSGEYVSPCVLVVEDAPEVALLLSSGLRSEGFEVVVAPDGEDALVQLRHVHPVAVILDLGLPGIDGFETCRRMRQISDVHIIMLTARLDETDKLVGFTTGADDYVTKPTSTRELAARVRAVVRRHALSAQVPATPPSPEKVLTIDSATRTVVVAGRSVTLTRTEFALFYELVRRSDEVVSRTELQTVVWGPDWRGGAHLVDVHVSNLRRKFTDAEAGWLIRTVREAGYCLSIAGAPGVIVGVAAGV